MVTAAGVGVSCRNPRNVDSLQKLEEANHGSFLSDFKGAGTTDRENSLCIVTKVGSRWWILGTETPLCETSEQRRIIVRIGAHLRDEMIVAFFGVLRTLIVLQDIRSYQEFLSKSITFYY